MHQDAQATREYGAADGEDRYKIMRELERGTAMANIVEESPVAKTPGYAAWKINRCFMGAMVSDASLVAGRAHVFHTVGRDIIRSFRCT